MIKFLKYSFNYSPMTLGSLPVAVFMFVVPFFYGYFSSDYTMDYDDKVGFGIYFTATGGAAIGLTYLLIDSWRKR